MEIITLLRSQVLSAKAVIINKTGKVLLVRHSYKGVNRWYLPGGIVWYGERPDNTIKRELMEELGLKVDKIELVGIYEGQNKSLAFLFVCETNYDLNAFNDRQFEIEEVSFFPSSKLPKNTTVGVREKIRSVKLYLKQKRKQAVWGYW